MTRIRRASRARAQRARRDVGVAAPSRARIRRRALDLDVEPAGGALERRRARRRDVRRVRGRVRARDGVRGRGPGRDGDASETGIEVIDWALRDAYYSRVVPALIPGTIAYVVLSIGSAPDFSSTRSAREAAAAGDARRWRVFNSREAARGAYDFDATRFSRLASRPTRVGGAMSVRRVAGF